MRTLLAQGKDNCPVGGVPAGTFAIYDSGPNGDDHRPAANPKGYMSRVGLHSALDYIGVVQELNATLTFGAVSNASPGTTTIKLYDHGLGAKPMAISMFSGDGVNWIGLNGDVYTAIGHILQGRRITIHADASSFYVRLMELGTIGAQTIQLRTYVLERSFTAGRVKTDEMFFSDGHVVRAAGGMFDTARRYLQEPADGQDGAFFHSSGQTHTAAKGPGTGEIDVEIHNSNLWAILVNAIRSNGTPLFTPPTTPFGAAVMQNALVAAGPAQLAKTIDMTPERIRIAADDGTDIFDTSRRIVTFVEEINRSIVTDAHPATAYASETPHEVIHAQIPLSAPVDLILGWAQITSVPAGVIILADMPFDISGSVLLYTSLKGDVSANLWMRTYSTLSARVVNGNLEIVEQWFNSTINGDSTAIPSISIDLRVFACALAGGF